MIGKRKKRTFWAYSDAGQADEVNEYPLIDSTVKRTVASRKNVESDSCHFATSDGVPLELVEEGVYRKPDGVILRER